MQPYRYDMMNAYAATKGTVVLCYMFQSGVPNLRAGEHAVGPSCHSRLHTETVSYLHQLGSQ